MCKFIICTIYNWSDISYNDIYLSHKILKLCQIPVFFESIK